ncbi:MAG: L-serine ammonia-lyase, iron-sulfur-dependent, subunit alpha [bacterium]|nr:L-serine ammonia-lyase, iron-sulfur-dependent, subunit alpha [bacterium]
MNITTFEKLIEKSENKDFFEIAQEYEAYLQSVSVQDIRSKVYKNIEAMKQAIKTGLNSAELSKSGLSGSDCLKLKEYFQKTPSIFGSLYQKILLYSLATAEENARMGRIVACPTAGSCGIVPAVLISVSEEENIDKDKQINALLIAGLIGMIISNKIELAGAVGGCQAECGVASAMAAALLAYLKGGDKECILNAVALALKNILGLTCDPVCGLVEVPCVKRNSFLSLHALTACQLALAGIKSKIPVDEVVDAMAQTGQLMSAMLKESSQAGLAKTYTAIELEKNF